MRAAFLAAALLASSSAAAQAVRLNGGNATAPNGPIVLTPTGTDCTAGTLAWAIAGDTDTGMTEAAANTLIACAGAIEGWRLTTSALTLSKPLVLPGSYPTADITSTTGDIMIGPSGNGQVFIRASASATTGVLKLEDKNGAARLSFDAPSAATAGAGLMHTGGSTTTGAAVRMTSGASAIGRMDACNGATALVNFSTTMSAAGDTPVANIDCAGVGYFSTGSPLVFDGATVDSNKTTFAITDPTAARTITFPDASVTVNAAANISGTTLASNVVTSSLTTVGALDSGSITSGFGAIDTGADNITTTGTVNGGTFQNGSNATNIKAGNDTILLKDSGGGTDATFTTNAAAAQIALSIGSNVLQLGLGGLSLFGTTNDVATTGVVASFADSQGISSTGGTQLVKIHGDGLISTATAANAACSSNAATITVVSPTMTVNPSGAACTLTVATTNVSTIARDVDVAIVINGSVGAGVVTLASTNFTHIPTNCSTTGIVNGDAIHIRYSQTLGKWVYLGGCT